MELTIMTKLLFHLDMFESEPMLISRLNTYQHLNFLFYLTKERTPVNFGGPCAAGQFFSRVQEKSALESSLGKYRELFAKFHNIYDDDEKKMCSYFFSRALSFYTRNN